MSMSKRKEKRDAEEKKYKNVKQPRMEPDETRVSEDGKTPPDMKRYMTAIQKRMAEQEMEEDKRYKTLLSAESRASKKEAQEELEIEKKRIEDEKFKKQMRQRR